MNVNLMSQLWISRILRENMMSRHVFAREQESGTLSMPFQRTEKQNALVRDGIKGNAVKTYTRYQQFTKY